MAFNPSLEVAIARDTAEKFNAEVGCIVIWVNEDTFGMASYGRNKILCAEMGKLGDHLYEETLAYLANEV